MTYKGQAIIHDDDETKAWFYPALAARVRPESEDQQQAFVHHLATDGRVVIEIVPDGRIGFDAEEMFRGSPAGPAEPWTGGLEPRHTPGASWGRGRGGAGPGAE